MHPIICENIPENRVAATQVCNDEREEKLQQEIQRLQPQRAIVSKERDALLYGKSEKEKESVFLKEQIDNAKKGLSTYFSSFQTSCMLTGKPISRWQDEDIARALTLRSLSTKAYRYLREKMKLPFPSISTLNRWISM